jgi:hypothetical protein
MTDNTEHPGPSTPAHAPRRAGHARAITGVSVGIVVVVLLFLGAALRSAHRGELDYEAQRAASAAVSAPATAAQP